MTFPVTRLVLAGTLALGGFLRAADAIPTPSPFMAAASSGNLAEVKKLVEAGQDVNAPGENGMTALMKASFIGNEDLVKYLLGKKADPNLQNGAQWTALMYASDKGHAKVVAALLSATADVNLVDKYGNQALIFAAGGKHPEVVAILIKAKADLNHVSEYNEVKKNTPLLAALEAEDEKSAGLLIDAKADVKLASESGNTPLTWASNRGYLPLVKKILAAGADINDTGKEGSNSALQSAAFKGQDKVVAFLLSKGADKSKKNFLGQTALDIAKRKNFPKVVTLLQ